MASNVSVYVVSAICGNFWIESGINSGIWESLDAGTWNDLNKGFGLGQWTNTGGDIYGRLYRLHSWLQDNGYNDDDFYGQLEYIEYEDVWYRRAEAYQFADLQAFLTSSSTNIELLTHAWNIGWEGIHNNTWDERVTHAEEVCAYIQQNYDPNTTYTPVTGNFYTSVSERYNNALYLYHVWNGGQPSPTPPTRNKKFKWWMYLPNTLK